jgi:hypothetical protein
MTDTPKPEELDPFPDDPILKDMGVFLHGLNTESDRGVVLVTASYLEDRLGILIGKFLVEGSDTKALVEEFNSPFGTFSARILGAHALGLIDQYEKERLTIIRKIRNDFAHDLKASFETQNIKCRLGNLKHYFHDQNGLEEIKDLPPRERFTIAGTQLVICLCNRIRRVEQRQLKLQDWPALEKAFELRS